MYFVLSARTLHLSLRVSKGLSLVPEDFPLNTQPVVGAAYSESIYGGVSYQASHKPTEDHFSPLEEWLLEYFSSTTFNTTRFPLSVMAGPPQLIHLVPSAASYTCHLSPVRFKALGGQREQGRH